MLSGANKIFTSSLTIHGAVIRTTTVTVNNVTGTTSEDISQSECKLIPTSLNELDTNNPNVEFSDSKFLCRTEKDVTLKDEVVFADEEVFSVVQVQRVLIKPKIFSIVVRSDRG